MVKNPPAKAGDTETPVQSLGWEDPLEKEMATCSRTLDWKIRWAEEPGGLQSVGSRELDIAEHIIFPLPCLPRASLSNPWRVQSCTASNVLLRVCPHRQNTPWMTLCVKRKLQEPPRGAPWLHSYISTVDSHPETRDMGMCM